MPGWKLVMGKQTFTQKVFCYEHSNIYRIPIVHMLWFKFILGLMFFELVSILFRIVPDYGNEYMTKENNN